METETKEVLTDNIITIHGKKYKLIRYVGGTADKIPMKED